MDIKFLEEYEKQEIENNKNYSTITERLGELKKPVYNLFTPTPSLWSQIAFSGTIIFPVRPLPEHTFERDLKLSIKKIPELIDFAKETNKIQFFICDYPTEYQRYDYLEPFFKESTPCYFLQRNEQSEELDDLFRKSEDELGMLFQLSPELKRLFTYDGGYHIFYDYVRQYTMIRYLEFDMFADVFIENILTYPKFATEYLETVYNLFVHPTIDPFNANTSVSFDCIRKATQIGLDVQVQPRNICFPEVGSFLLKKIIYYPESLEACKQVIALYEENDLYNVYSALNNAVIERNHDSALKNDKDLELILDNTWKETQTIQSNATVYKYGIGVTCGIIGDLISPLLGLSQGLGYLVPLVGSQYLDRFTELIAKKVASPYLATIYDFQDKYRINTG